MGESNYSALSGHARFRYSPHAPKKTPGKTKLLVSSCQDIIQTETSEPLARESTATVPFRCFGVLNIDGFINSCWCTCQKYIHTLKIRWYKQTLYNYSTQNVFIVMLVLGNSGAKRVCVTCQSEVGSKLSTLLAGAFHWQLWEASAVSPLEQQPPPWNIHVNAES